MPDDPPTNQNSHSIVWSCSGEVWQVKTMLVNHCRLGLYRERRGRLTSYWTLACLKDPNDATSLDQLFSATVYCLSLLSKGQPQLFFFRMLHISEGVGQNVQFCTWRDCDVNTWQRTHSTSKRESILHESKKIHNTCRSLCHWRPETFKCSDLDCLHNSLLTGSHLMLSPLENEWPNACQGNRVHAVAKINQDDIK